MFTLYRILLCQIVVQVEMCWARGFFCDKREDLCCLKAKKFSQSHRLPFHRAGAVQVFLWALACSVPQFPEATCAAFNCLTSDNPEII